MKNSNQENRVEKLYFTSPAEAIPMISKLLQKNDFKTLARYYDLSNSETKLSDLESGDFFIRKERPEAAHPGGFWSYKHPFAPGFKYKGVRKTGRDPIHVVEVSISIDQGPDSPEQIGLSYFYMIKSQEGWRILPDQVTNDVHEQ